MRKKLLAFIPVLGLASILGANVALAQGFPSNATPDQISTRQQDMFQKEATLLNISVDDVKNAWAEGKTIKQIMTEKGITQAQIDARMKEARSEQLKTQLTALVSKGVITQAQADKRLQAVQAQIANGKANGKMGMKGGGHRGFGF